MRIVFWKNSLSPHLLPFIARLLDDERVDEVVVTAGNELTDDRKEMGWQIGSYPGLERCKVYINPNAHVIGALLWERTEDTWHVFSGMRGFPYVYKCLTMSMKYRLQRAMISELPNTFAFGRANGKPLWLHRLRFRMQDRKLAPAISRVFAMGSRAVRYFESVHKDWRVFPFLYCTQPADTGAAAPAAGSAPKFIFVGSLSYRKAPDTITRSLRRCLRTRADFRGEVVFVGDGEKRRPMEEYVKRHGLEGHVAFAGFKPQGEVPHLMAANDILILSSVYDGWGAVVNEALQAGLFVLVTDACGASDLVKQDERLGRVFHKGDVHGLADLMLWCEAHIDQIRADRAFRRQWADEHISGRVVARRFVDCLVQQ